jgi:hypothetical protein
MTRVSLLAALGAASLVLAAGATTTSAQPAAAGNAVTDWTLFAVNTLTGLPGPAGGAPPAAQIHVGMVQGAVYDAVNATVPKHHRPYLLNRRGAATASKEAAVATAAHDVLSNIVSTVPGFAGPARTALLQSIDSKYAEALTAVEDGPFEKQGVAVGAAAAAAMIAARQNDGRFGPSQWKPNTAAGHWDPIDPNTGLPVLDPTPWVGGVKPFLLQTGDQFRSAGPLGLGSGAYATEFNEVKTLGAVNSATRTALQTNIARWWQSTPNWLWNSVAADLIARTNMDIVDSARLLAMSNLSAADASINCWNDKYHFDFWRPWHAIRRADEDDNLATDQDATWKPLITAPYPEHPSGHNCLDAAHVRVLRMFFPDATEFQITSKTTLPIPDDFRTRPFESFSQALGEVIEARIWGGLHFRTADVQAQQLGRNVADYMAAHYFQPVNG